MRREVESYTKSGVRASLEEKHDEWVFEVDEAEVELVSCQIVSSMQNAARLEVSLVVDMSVGQDWEAAH